MIVVVPTVPKTGSNLVLREVLKGFTKIQAARSHREKSVVFTHVDPRARKLLPWLTSFLSEYPAIVPLRHPMRCAESWKAWGKSVTEMLNYWHNLIQNIDPHNPYYLPIDQDNRDEWLAAINSKLGTDFKTDWPVIASSNKTATLTEDETAEVEQFMLRHNEFFDRFGYAP